MSRIQTRRYWAICSRSGSQNIDESTLAHLRKESWRMFFERVGVTPEKENWYRRHWKAVKVTLSYDPGPME